MKTLVILGLLTIVGVAQAAPVRRLYQDVKLPSQQIIEKQTVTAPAAAGTTQVLSGSAGPTSAALTTVTSFSAQPDVPRNLVVTPGGTTGDVESCNVIVAGTNIFNQSIQETFHFAVDASSGVTGSYAFKTVTSVTWQANCESGGFAATWSIGYGSKLGLKRCMAKAVDFLAAGLNGTREGTFATVVANSSLVHANTAALNSSLNSVDVQLYFMQNYGCFP